MAKHTNGPWAFDAERGEIYADDGDVCPLIATVNFDNTSDEQAVADGVLLSSAPELREALIAAKQEMWLIARHQWTMADFKNWAVIQRIDAALEKSDGRPRTAAAVALAEG